MTLMAESAFDPKPILQTLPHSPGVYRMLDAQGDLLYVGKAIDLKKRVASYFTRSVTNPRIIAMVAQIRAIEVAVTNTEAEALLLESNLIKQHRPRYNVVLRDDKSYPYIYVSSEDRYPRMALHRGARKRRGRYFGPYASATAVRDTLNLLQKLFQVRQCSDSFFQNRSRPCLQYQIKRCTAPCVGYIDADDYRQDVDNAMQFLQGESANVIDTLVARMEQAAAALDFEAAAQYRDRIAQLRQISEQQHVSHDRGDVDIVAACLAGGLACVQVFCVRGGLNLGNKDFFPKLPEAATEGEVIAGFIAQYYLERDIPAEIVVSALPDERALLEEALSSQRGRKVSISRNVRGERARWLELAQRNAELALAARQQMHSDYRDRLEALQQALELPELPTRMECFDISHSQGEATVASCVVFDINGPAKSDYRRFNIQDITPGDDYAAMQQALTRRYTRLKKGEGKLPDVLLIDGGRGQVGQAQQVLEDLQVDSVTVVGVAKGESRKPGLETLILCEPERSLSLPAQHQGLHLIQQIRDEAHRFALTGHRQRRSKARNTSPLEQIPGLGPKRRQQLLKQFGGLQGVSRAGVEEIAKVEGISKRLAQQIYDHFR